MNIFSEMRQELDGVLQHLRNADNLPPGDDPGPANLEPPRDPAHGDMATNVAMVLAAKAGVKPRDLAGQIAESLTAVAGIAEVTIAGPGFINLHLKPELWQRVLATILRHGTAYGDGEVRGEAVNVEYVSANPTGPLHVGHARGAVFGDVLSRLLAKAGYQVTKEYYVNDAGAQVEHLARSAYYRYRQALYGESAGAVGPEPEEFYPGDYLRPVGIALHTEYGDGLADCPESEWLPTVRRHTLEAMMALIRDDLAALGVAPDVFASEAALVAAGRVDEALADLQARGLLYTGVPEAPKGARPDDWEPRPQTLFRSADFGDDVDRPLRKSDGSWTYFASDIAYHYDKYRRGFCRQIDVWGADHSGYVKRMQGAVRAVTDGNAHLTVRICQMVRLLDRGRPVKMSKRAGAFVSLGDLVQAVGRDVVRFYLLTRKNDAPIDFDLSTVREQSRDNPVFYVHYAHARCRSAFRQAADVLGAVPDPATADLALLVTAEELSVLKLLAQWPRIVETAAAAEEPHRVAYYLHDLAGAFHGLWTRGKEQPALRFIVPDDPALSAARLALVEGVRIVIASGLEVFGVTPAEELV